MSEQVSMFHLNAYKASAVCVLDNTTQLLQHGVIIAIRDDAFFVDFGSANRHAERVAAADCRFPAPYRIPSWPHIGEPVQVLHQRTIGDPWYWYPATVLVCSSSMHKGWHLVEIGVGADRVRAIVPSTRTQRVAPGDVKFSFAKWDEELNRLAFDTARELERRDERLAEAKLLPTEPRPEIVAHSETAAPGINAALPLELLAEILSLDIGNRCNSFQWRRVCRLWKALVESPSAWQRVVMDLATYDSFQDARVAMVVNEAQRRGVRTLLITGEDTHNFFGTAGAILHAASRSRIPLVVLYKAHVKQRGLYGNFAWPAPLIDATDQHYVRVMPVWRDSCQRMVLTDVTVDDVKMEESPRDWANAVYCGEAAQHRSSRRRWRTLHVEKEDIDTQGDLAFQSVNIILPS